MFDVMYGFKVKFASYSCEARTINVLKLLCTYKYCIKLNFKIKIKCD